MARRLKMENDKQKFIQFFCILFLLVTLFSFAHFVSADESDVPVVSYEDNAPAAAAPAPAASEPEPYVPVVSYDDSTSSGGGLWGGIKDGFKSIIGGGGTTVIRTEPAPNPSQLQRVAIQKAMREYNTRWSNAEYGDSADLDKAVTAWVDANKGAFTEEQYTTMDTWNGQRQGSTIYGMLEDNLKEAPSNSFWSKITGGDSAPKESSVSTFFSNIGGMGSRFHLAPDIGACLITAFIFLVLCKTKLFASKITAFFAKHFSPLWGTVFLGIIILLIYNTPGIKVWYAILLFDINWIVRGLLQGTVHWIICALLGLIPGMKDTADVKRAAKEAVDRANLGRRILGGVGADADRERRGN